MMAKRRARWKRTDRWRLKTAFDIPALLISLILWHTVVKAFPNCCSCSHLTVSLLSHQEAACSSPKRAASVKLKTIFSRYSSFVIFRDRLSASPLFAWGVKVGKILFYRLTCPASSPAATTAPLTPPRRRQAAAAVLHLNIIYWPPGDEPWICPDSTQLDFFCGSRTGLCPCYIVVSWSYYTHTYYTTFKQVPSTRSSFRVGSLLNRWKTLDWVLIRSWRQICNPSPALTRQYFQ